MMHSRRRFFAALAALAAMLFAQAAFAVAACDTGSMPSRAQVLAQGEEHAPCHQPVDNVNLCLAHCQSAEQTLDKQQVKLPALPAAPVLEIRGWQSIGRLLAWMPRAPAPAAGPPLRILYSSLLI
ncbi:MAG TPA: hypothetical protein VFZ54_09220 [Burkholderiales bacterium]